MLSLRHDGFHDGIVFGVSVSLILFVCGLFLYTVEKRQISELPEQKIICFGLIDEIPVEKTNSYSLVLRLEGWSSAEITHEAAGGILLYIEKDTMIKDWLPGDYLSLSCRVSPVVNRGNPGEFNYRLYMLNKGIRYSAYAGKVDILNHSYNKQRSLKHRALIVRQRIISMYRERGISGENLALSAAITLGDKELLEPEQKEAYIKAGVMHVMAVSGMHAVILSLFIFKVLFFLRGRYNWIRIIITLLVLWVFTFITGLTPSVMRASVMFTFLNAGTLMKRPVNGLNSLLASALVLALIKPSVILEAGFLLSYSAVLFIISFYNDLYKSLGFRHYVPDLIWQSVAVSIVAQAGTLPLTISMFNRFPVLFLIANLLIVPVTSLIIITGCLIPLFYPVRIISGAFAFVLEKLTDLTNLLTVTIASLPGSTIGNLGISSAACLVLTAALYLLFHTVLKRRISRLPAQAAWVFFLIFTIIVTARVAHTRLTSELIVYNSYSGLSVGIRRGNRFDLISDSSSTNSEALRHASVIRAQIRKQIAGEEPLLLKTGGKKILLTKMIDNQQLSVYAPDVAVITGSGHPVTTTFSSAGNCTYVFTGKNIKDYRLSGGGLFSVTDSLHFVQRSGAYRLTIENKSRKNLSIKHFMH